MQRLNAINPQRKRETNNAGTAASKDTKNENTPNHGRANTLRYDAETVNTIAVPPNHQRGFSTLSSEFHDG